MTSPNATAVTTSAAGVTVAPPSTRQSLSSSSTGSWQCQNCAAPTARVSLARVLELCVAQALYDLEISQDNGERKTGPSVKALLAPLSDDSLQPLYAAYGYSLLPMLLPQQNSSSTTTTVTSGGTSVTTGGNNGLVENSSSLALEGLESKLQSLLQDSFTSSSSSSLSSLTNGGVKVVDADTVMNSSDVIEREGLVSTSDLPSPTASATSTVSSVEDTSGLQHQQTANSGSTSRLASSSSSSSSAKSRALINASAKLDPFVLAKAFSTGLEASCVPSTPATLSDFIACIRSCKYASVAEAIEDLRAFITAIHVLTGGSSSSSSSSSTTTAQGQEGGAGPVVIVKYSNSISGNNSESFAEWRSPSFNAATTDDVSMHAGFIKPYLPVLTMQTTTPAMARSSTLATGFASTNGGLSRSPLVIAAGQIASAIEKAILYPKKHASILKEADEALIAAAKYHSSKEGGPPSAFPRVALPNSLVMKEAYTNAATYLLVKRGGKFGNNQGGVSPEGSRSHSPLIEGAVGGGGGQPFLPVMKYGEWVLRLAESMGLREDHALARLYSARKSSSRPELALCGTMSATFERLSLEKSTTLVLSAVASKGEKLKGLEDRTVKAVLVQQRKQQHHVQQPRFSKSSTSVNGVILAPMVTEKGGLVLKSSSATATSTTSAHSGGIHTQRAASPTSAALIAYEEYASTIAKGGSSGGDAAAGGGGAEPDTSTTLGGGEQQHAQDSLEKGEGGGDLVPSTKKIFDSLYRAETESIAVAASKFLAASESSAGTTMSATSSLSNQPSIAPGSFFHAMLESEPGIVFSTFDRHIAGVAKSYYSAAVLRKERLLSNHTSGGGGGGGASGSPGGPGENRQSTSPGIETTESSIPDSLVTKFEMMANWGKRISSTTTSASLNLASQSQQQHASSISKIQAPVAVKAGEISSSAGGIKGVAASAMVAPLQQSASWTQLRRQLQEQNLQQRSLIEANERSILASLGLLQHVQVQQQPSFSSSVSSSIDSSSQYDANNTLMSSSIPQQQGNKNSDNDIHGLLGLSSATLSSSSSSSSSYNGVDMTQQQNLSSSFAPIFQVNNNDVNHHQQQQQQLQGYQTFKQQQFLVHSLLSQERRITEQDNLLNAAVSMLSSQLDGLRAAILSASSSPMGGVNSARTSTVHGGETRDNALDAESGGGSLWGPAAEAQRLRSIIARMPPRDRVGAQTLFEISPLDGEDGGLTSLAHLLPPSEDQVLSLFNTLSSHHRRAMIAAGELRSAWTASRRGLFTVPAFVDEDARLRARAGALDDDGGADGESQERDPQGEGGDYFSTHGGGENGPSSFTSSADALSGGVITLGEGNVALEYAVANANLRERTAQLEIELAAARVRLERSETQVV